MSRDPALVAREEAARVGARVEAALAKAIAESTRPLILAGSPVAAQGGPSAPVDQQQQQQPQQQPQGNINTGNTNKIGPNQSILFNPGAPWAQQHHQQQPEVTPPKGTVANRIRKLEDASSPPAGQDMAALSGGLPAETHEAWGEAPTTTRQLGASPPTPPTHPSVGHMNATLNSSTFSYRSMDTSSEAVVDEIDAFLHSEGMPKGQDNQDDTMAEESP
jgi:hypothetical protein